MTLLFNTALIGQFRTEMFQTLLYKHQLTTTTPKLVDFHQDYNLDVSVTELDPVQGYYFVKDNKKYLLPQKTESGTATLEKLPIRIHDTVELNTVAKDVVHKIKRFASFRFVPDKKYDLNQISGFDGINHMDMPMWNLLKIITYTAYCRRINIIMSGIRESGKTSYFDALGQLTNRGYVVKQPRSILGLTYGLFDDGYIVLDEMSGLTSEQRRIIANFLYQVGERNNSFKTGKGLSAAHNLLASYDIHNLSCVILCNLMEDYKAKDQFFHYMFDNSQAINDRFLQLRINPPDTPVSEDKRRLLKCYLDTKQFKATRTQELTKDIWDIYVGIVKSLEWYKQNWFGQVNWAFVDASITTKHTGRHYLSYRELLGGIYIWTHCQPVPQCTELYYNYKGLLDNWIKYYQEALEWYKDLKPEEVEREDIA